MCHPVLIDTYPLSRKPAFIGNQQSNCVFMQQSISVSASTFWLQMLPFLLSGSSRSKMSDPHALKNNILLNPDCTTARAMEAFQ